MIEYLFLTTASLVNLDGRVSTWGASARLGSLAPTYALTQLGYEARTINIKADFAAAQAAVRAAKRVVFGEMFDAPAGWDLYRRLLGVLHDRRKQAIFSIADDHFQRPDFREFYREALTDCLAVTTVSERLAQTIRQLTSRPVHVAPEPYEGSRGAPHAVSARRPSRAVNWLARRIGIPADIWRVRLLWFGYPTNLPALLAMVPALEEFSRRCALLLTCVTLPVPEIAQLLTPQRLHDGASLRTAFLDWSPQAMEAAIGSSDIVLIPSDYRNPVKQAKSPNRLIAGLHGGRFVLAHPLPAYEPYAAFAWLGEDLCEGLRWALAHPREVLERIRRGHDFIDSKHSPEAVARFWLDVFDPKVTRSA